MISETYLMQAEVRFKEMIQDSQDFGSDDEHMVSRIIFDLVLDEARYENLFVDVKQVAGSSFESYPLEISYPASYQGPFNHEAFRDAAERYYRNLVGGQGSVIHIGSGAKIRMRNNRFVQPVVEHFEISAEKTMR
jgi:hypothetical protein